MATDLIIIGIISDPVPIRKILKIGAGGLETPLGLKESPLANDGGKHLSTVETEVKSI
jgi:hypothetical protein